MIEGNARKPYLDLSEPGTRCDLAVIKALASSDQYGMTLDVVITLQRESCECAVSIDVVQYDLIESFVFATQLYSQRGGGSRVKPVPEHLGFILAEIAVQAGTAGTGRMAPQTSTRICARMNYVQGHVSRVNV